MAKKSFFLWFVLLSAGAMAQDGISAARWQANKVVTDGENSEWKKPLNFYDAVTGLLFTITNDSSQLYLCFTNNDERKVTKMMKAGWQLDVFSKEKNDRFNASIVFPAVQMLDAPGRDEGVAKAVSADFKNQIALYRLNLQSINASGFVKTNGMVPLGGSGIGVGIGSDSTQAIIYEIAIPFSELLAGKAPGFNSEIGLHITVHALPKPRRAPRKDGEAGADGKIGVRNKRELAEEVARYNDQRTFFTEIDFKQRFRLVAHL